MRDATYRRVPKISPYGKRACACAQRPGLPQACGCGLLAYRHLQAGGGAHGAFASRDTLAATPGLLAHASVTEVVQIYSMGSTLGHTAVQHLFASQPRHEGCCDVWRPDGPVAATGGGSRGLPPRQTRASLSRCACSVQDSVCFVFICICIEHTAARQVGTCVD